MEADGERSVSVLKEFQIKSYLAPVTPMKPDIRQIYANGNTAVQPSVAYLEESEAYGFGLSQQWNLTQGSESCSTSNYAENSNFNSRAAAEEHRLDGYLPQWNHDEVQSMVSQMPVHHMNRFGQAYTRKHNRLDQDAMVPLQGPDDPLAHLSHFKFGDLLGMNQFGLAPPISGNPLGDGGSTSGSGSGSGSGSLIVDLNSPWEENMYTEGQGMLRGSNQYMSGNCAPEMQHCDIPCHVYGNFYDSNSLQSTKNSFPNGNRSIYAPATPDQSKLLSERTRLSTVQAAYQHYMEQENQVAATTRVDLQGIQNNEAEAPPGSDASPGKMSTLVENHDLDKGNSEGFDLNKSPQQKPRRKKHRPKVVREAKPKRAPKPSTPKPTNPTKNPQAKRKYVRKNKTNVPLTTPARSSELPNPDPRNPVVNSCRRSLNFDLDERVREDSTLHRSNYTSYSAPQANGASASENPLSHAIPFGKEKEAVVQMLNAGTAYDITYSVNQQLKEYIKLSQGETSNTSSLPKAIPSQVNGKVFAVDQNSRMENNQAVSYPMEGSSSKRLFKADSFVAQSTNASTSTSPVDGEHRQKRTFSASVDRLDEETRKLAANHGAFCSLNNLFYGDGKINIMANLLFPDICKKRRSEKVQRLNTSCGSSSATTLEDERDLAMNCDGAAGDTTASKYYFSPPAPNFATAHTDMAEAAGASYETRMQFVHNWTDIHKFKKKRSKVLTRARDLASLTGFAERTETDDTPVNQARKYTRKKADVTNSQIACLEALAADNHVPRMTKKRSRARFVKSNRSNVKEPKMQPDLLVNANQKRTEKAIGPLLALPWPDISVDDITDRLQKLDMNRESSNIVSSHENALVRYQANGQVEASFTQKQNALVLYQKAGTIVPFEGPFDPAKKRRQRAKVDLDEETTRVWKLLLENIDNAGINGTDEDKVKWWEEERRVFHGRVDSFIARMRLVQGDRRFSPWKGSVVDSVIGVFLTQNVSDHLSSSAFMSLAAHFPLKSRSKVKAKYEEGTGASPESSVLDLEGFEICGAKLSDEQVWDRNSRTLYDADHGEEKEVVNSRELLEGNLGLSPQDTHGSIIVNSCQSSQKLPQELVERHTNYIIDMETASTNGDARAMDDVTSSLHSVLSSLASTNSPSGLTAGRMGSSPESNSEVDDPITRANSGVFGYSTSYTELLKMAENPILQETCINRGSYSLSYQGSTNNEQQCREVEQQLWILEKDIHESTLKAPNISSNNRLHLRTDVQLQDANCARMVDEESRSSDNSATKDDNCTTEQSDLSNESAIQSPFQEKVAEKNQKPVSSAENICSSYVFDGERMVMKSQRQVTAAHEAPTQPAHEEGCLMPKAMDLPPGRTHESESNRTWDDRNTNSHNDMPVPRHNTKGSANKIGDVGMIKQTKGKAGKGKNTASDWDSLRKYAEMNDRKRERTSHTMDSLDYEAVRRADVGEIADTIKERGMNNMLAERMKDFLNRLVADHGSIDLEWLRDVPPDKAKEYLLSVRGLGLKSVECVRLLTLHHLAFPVDTNVGRIAVRLGWVPLQPLPESLQLHLLELYPVLESIQKYLWPRLCKLDQRTLYELHYHMITFGKVFCTKRQPNCNACPLRGECRHFASAFASARLALPGPEERSIMPSNQCGVAHQDPKEAINPTALPLPQAIQHSTSAQCGLIYQDAQVIINPLQTLHSASSHSCLNYQDTQANIKSLALPQPQENQHLEAKVTNCEPIIEVPASPEPEQTKMSESDIEDLFSDDPDEIPMIKLNMQQFTQTLENYMQSNMELQQSDMSKALVTLTAEVASIPTPKLKNISRLRTEHHVYELPDTHPLLDGMDKREPDDPCSYLLAIWTPGETANSTQPPEQRCSTQEPGQLCDDEACFHCNSQREANCQIVRGTLLIPCRTAMRGSFPLNGTYFQVNEVFADHDSSLNPIAVPRNWLWNLHRRTVYFGTSIPTIFRGLSTEGIQHCFWRGYVCVRGFDQKTRAPRPLMARLHFPASKMTKAKGKPNNQQNTT